MDCSTTPTIHLKVSSILVESSSERISPDRDSAGEVHYSVQDAHTWLLDSGAKFHVTLNIELRGRNERHRPTRQWAGVQNRGNRRSSRSITKWKYNHHAPRRTCTRTEKEFGLHQHASWRRVHINDSQWVDMDDQPRKSLNRKRARVQQLLPNNGDQSKRVRERSRKDRPEPQGLWGLGCPRQSGSSRIVPCSARIVDRSPSSWSINSRKSRDSLSVVCAKDTWSTIHRFRPLSVFLMSRLTRVSAGSLGLLSRTVEVINRLGPSNKYAHLNFPLTIM